MSAVHYRAPSERAVWHGSNHRQGDRLQPITGWVYVALQPWQIRDSANHVQSARMEAKERTGRAKSSATMKHAFYAVAFRIKAIRATCEGLR